MFTWICPKCGKDVPPAYAECPNCAAAQRGTLQQPAASQPKPQEAQTSQPGASPIPASGETGPTPQATGPGPAARRRMSPWLVTMNVALTCVSIFAAVLWFTRSPGTTAQPVHAVQPALETPGIAAPTPVASSNPILKQIELTGLRLTEDSAQKPYIELVAVNHSAADLGEISETVNLKAVAAKNTEPIGTFPLKTSLGPYESKDIKVPVTTKLRAYEFPDWQFLRAEFTQ